MPEPTVYLRDLKWTFVIEPGAAHDSGHTGVSEGDGKWWTIGIAACSIAIILSATLAGRAFTALGIGSFDIKLFLYVGQQWVAGLTPYRDLFENKPPGVFVLARIAQSATSPLAFIATVEGLIVLGTSACTWLLLRLLGCSTLLRWFGAVSVALCLNLSAMHGGDLPTELLLSLPATASALFLLQADRRPRGSAILTLLGGLFCGIAVLLKTPGLAVLLAYSAAVVFAIVVRRNMTAGKGISRLLLAWAGCGLAFVWPLMYFAAINATGELFDAMFTYNRHYGHATRPNPLKSALSLFGKAQPVATVFALATVTGYGAIANAITRGRKSVNIARADDLTEGGISAILFLALWLAADLAGAMAGGRAYAHYLLSAVPSATILAALTIDYVRRSVREHPMVPRILVTCAIAPLLAGMISDVRLIRELAASPPQRYWEGAANAINKTACPNDRLFAWEYMPGISQATNLRPATIVESGHYLNDSPYARDKFGIRLRTDLGSAPPEFLVVKASPEPDDMRESSARDERAFVVELARSKYDVIFRQENGPIVVYRRKGHSCGIVASG